MPETIRPAPNYLVSLSCVRPRLLYVTNFGYPARGRDYPTEDIMLTGRLRDEFDLAVCHPLDTTALMDSFDAVVVRNSGPVLGYQAAYDEFRRRAVDRRLALSESVNRARPSVRIRMLAGLTSRWTMRALCT